MLLKKKWHSIGLFLLLIMGVVAFGAVLVARFHQTNISPPRKNTQTTPEQSQAETLRQTDKVELSQTELIAVAPSKAVATAEQALPADSELSYSTACQRLKRLYMSDNEAKQAEEGRRYQSAQQSVINKYSRENMAFSTKQKSAQAFEAKKHDLIVRQLDSQLRRQLKSINC